MSRAHESTPFASRRPPFSLFPSFRPTLPRRHCPARCSHFASRTQPAETCDEYKLLEKLNDVAAAEYKDMYAQMQHVNMEQQELRGKYVA